MPAGHPDIYRLPRLYDIAFERDHEADVDALMAICDRHMKRAPQQLLELAAGPARTALTFATRGVQAVALDCSPEMARYAASLAHERGVALETVVADMTSFQLEQRFDLIVLMMNSAVYLTEEQALERHLHTVADHLLPGGLYVLEMQHPRDVFGVGKSAQTDWTAERDGTTVHMRWGEKDDPFDPITQVAQVTVRMRWEEGDETTELVQQSPERHFTACEFRALVAATGRFELVEVLGAMNPAVPFDNSSEAWRMVPILRKQP